MILIKGPPGSGKTTLAWHVCQEWESGILFPEFELVVYVQLRDPAIQVAGMIADLLPRRMTKWLEMFSLSSRPRTVRVSSLSWMAGMSSQGSSTGFTSLTAH